MSPSVVHRIFSMIVLGAALSASALEIDGIAAKVGTDVILRSDVVEEMRRAGLDETHFAEVRNDLINRKLILQAAMDSKMTMQEWVVDNRIREIISKSFDGDRNRLMETLARQKQGYPEWRAKVKEDMIVSAMRWNVVEKNVNASPSAMRTEYQTHPERYRSEAKTSVSVILLKPEDSSKRLEITAALKTERFEDLARRYSADSHAAEGGLWKDVRPEDVFKPEICTAISALQPGGTSNWIELDGWSFLIRKESETAASVRTFDEAYEDIEHNVKDAVADSVFSAWIDRLRAEAYIKVY